MRTEDSEELRARLLAETPRWYHPWVHLACHGSQHPEDPTESAFRLADGQPC